MNSAFHSPSGGSAAEFDPFHAHLQQYEWALAQYLGYGVAASYRGPRYVVVGVWKGILILAIPRYILVNCDYTRLSSVSTTYTHAHTPTQAI